MSSRTDVPQDRPKNGKQKPRSGYRLVVIGAVLGAGAMLLCLGGSGAIALALWLHQHPDPVLPQDHKNQPDRDDVIAAPKKKTRAGPVNNVGAETGKFHDGEYFMRWELPGPCTDDDPEGLTAGHSCNILLMPVRAGRTYRLMWCQANMLERDGFKPAVRVEDPGGNELQRRQSNADQVAEVVFTPRTDGLHRIIATTQNKMDGHGVLVVQDLSDPAPPPPGKVPDPLPEPINTGVSHKPKIHETPWGVEMELTSWRSHFDAPWMRFSLDGKALYVVERHVNKERTLNRLVRIELPEFTETARLDAGIEQIIPTEDGLIVRTPGALWLLDSETLRVKSHCPGRFRTVNAAKRANVVMAELETRRPMASDPFPSSALIDLNAGKVLRYFGEGWGSRFAVTPDGNHVLAIGSILDPLERTLLRRYRIEKANLVEEQSHACYGLTPLGMVISPDGKEVWWGARGALTNTRGLPFPLPTPRSQIFVMRVHDFKPFPRPIRDGVPWPFLDPAGDRLFSVPAQFAKPDVDMCDLEGNVIRTFKGKAAPGYIHDVHPQRNWIVIAARESPVIFDVKDLRAKK